MRSGVITRSAIRPETVLGLVGGPEDGAAVLFLGMVRRENEGRAVSGVRYEAYEAMAVPVLEGILEEAAVRWQLGRLTAVHRVGQLAVGEVSVAVAVSAPHRGPAYEASRFIIDQIKLRLPVWKQESYENGEARWLEGALPPVADR